jgi:hypothetical protein
MLDSFGFVFQAGRGRVTSLIVAAFFQIDYVEHIIVAVVTAFGITVVIATTQNNMFVDEIERRKLNVLSNLFRDWMHLLDNPL